jgi:hypothetical protein
LLEEITDDLLVESRLLTNSRERFNNRGGIKCFEHIIGGNRNVFIKSAVRVMHLWTWDFLSLLNRGLGLGKILLFFVFNHLNLIINLLNNSIY